MATCRYCKQEISHAMSCDAQTRYRSGSTVYSRIPYGEERRESDRAKMAARCPDCQVALGSVHHPGCVREECPICHNQLPACHCPLAIVQNVAQKERPRRETSLALAEDPPEHTEEENTRQPSALPSWAPTDEQRQDSLEAVRLGRLAGCWERSDCSITISDGQVRHECHGEVEMIPFADEKEVVARLKLLHAPAAA